MALLTPRSSLLADVNVGDEPTLSFAGVDGTKVDAAFLAKKVVVVDFWATWCGPCIQAMPHMISLHEKYSSKGLQIVGISLDRDKERLSKYVAEKKLGWPHYFDGKGWKNDIASAWGVSSIPAIFILSPAGKVVWKGHPSEMDAPLERALKTFLGVDPIADPEVGAEEKARMAAEAVTKLEAATKAFAAGKYEKFLGHLEGIDARTATDKKVIAAADAFIEKLMSIEDRETQTKIRSAFQANIAVAQSFGEFMRAVQEAKRIKVGDKPEVKFTALDGTKVGRKYLEGKLVILDFWATWCGPCIAAMPHMKELHEKYASRGVEIVGVSLDREKRRLVDYVEREKIAWVQYFDEGGKMSRTWGVSGIPSIFILSPKGEVLWNGHPSQMDAALEQAMKDHPPAKGRKARDA